MEGEKGFFLIFFIFAFHFSKPLNFVLGLPKWEFPTGKRHFTLGKNSGKMTLPLLKNIPLTPLPCIQAVYIKIISAHYVLAVFF